MLLLPHLYLLLPALVPGVSTGTKVGQGICHVTRWIQHAVILYISRMSSQPPLTPPAPVFNGHPHSLFPRMLEGAQFGMQEVEGTAWRRPLGNSPPGGQSTSRDRYRLQELSHHLLPTAPAWQGTWVHPTSSIHSNRDLGTQKCVVSKKGSGLLSGSL